MVLNVRRNHKAYQRLGGGGGGMEVGEEGDYNLYVSLHCHHRNDSCIEMGSDESHFNVSLIVRDSHKTVSTNYDLFD